MDDLLDFALKIIPTVATKTSLLTLESHIDMLKKLAKINVPREFIVTVASALVNRPITSSIIPTIPDVMIGIANLQEPGLLEKCIAWVLASPLRQTQDLLRIILSHPGIRQHILTPALCILAQRRMSELRLTPPTQQNWRRPNAKIRPSTNSSIPPQSR